MPLKTGHALAGFCVIFTGCTHDPLSSPDNQQSACRTPAELKRERAAGFYRRRYAYKNIQTGLFRFFKVADVDIIFH